MVRMIRATLDEKLLDAIRQKFPEIKGLTATGIIDWALRKLLIMDGL